MNVTNKLASIMAASQRGSAGKVLSNIITSASKTNTDRLTINSIEWGGFIV